MMGKKSIMYLVLAIWLCNCIANFAIDWQKKDYDNLGSRNSEETGFDGTISLKWAFLPTNQIPVYATPIVYNGAVLLMQQNGLIYLLSEDSGSFIWIEPKNIFDELVATPLIDNGEIYIITKSCRLYILDFETGKTKYKKVFDATCMDSVVKESNILYIPLGFPKNKVIKFDLTTKTEVKNFSDITGQPFYTAPRLDGNNLYFTSTSGYIYKIDKNDFTPPIWSSFFRSIISSWNTTIDSTGFYFFPSGNDLTIYKFNKTNHNTVWSQALSIPKPSYKIQIINSNLRRQGIPYQYKFVDGNQKPSSGSGNRFAPEDAEPSGSASNIATDSTHICFIIGLPAYYLICADKSNGNLTTKYLDSVNTGILPIGAPVIKNDLVYFALPVKNEFYVSDKSGNIVNSYTLNGGVYASVVAANAKLFVATNKGGLYVFETSGNHAPAKPSITSPTNLADINSDSVTVTWTANDQENDSLIYTLKVTDENTKITQEFSNLTNTSFTLANLGLNTQYTLQVRAFENNEKKAYSPWSNKVSFFYKRFQGIKPLPPKNLVITSTQIQGGFNFIISWERPDNSLIRGYKFSYTARYLQEIILLEQEITDTSLVLTTNCQNVREFGCLAANLIYDITINSVGVDGLTSDPVNKSFFSGASIFLNDIPQSGLTLQDVINNANINDTIKISAITLSNQPIVINKPIKIQGSDPLNTILSINGDKGIVVSNIQQKVSAKPDIMVEISNVTIVGASTAIEVNAPTRIKNCVLIKGTTGIVANSDTEVINNTIADNSSNGISINSGNHLIKNNIIGNNAGNGLSLNAGNISTLKYNIFFNNLLGNVTPNVTVDSTNLIGFTVNFKNESSNDYREVEGSPSVDNGDPQDDFSAEPLPNGNRINIGAFGNTLLATKTIISTSPPPYGTSNGGGGCYIHPRQYNNIDNLFSLFLLCILVYVSIRLLFAVILQSN